MLKGQFSQLTNNIPRSTEVNAIWLDFGAQSIEKYDLKVEFSEMFN